MHRCQNRCYWSPRDCVYVEHQRLGVLELAPAITADELVVGIGSSVVNELLVVLLTVVTTLGSL